MSLMVANAFIESPGRLMLTEAVDPLLLTESGDPVLLVENGSPVVPDKTARELEVS